MSDARTTDDSRFINRELSWLAFNERVLEEAVDDTNPLLERIKFAAIVASNLDEFFMVRVANLHQAVDEGDQAPDPSGLTPSQQLSAVSQRAGALTAALYELVSNALMPALATAGARIAACADLTMSQQASLEAWFRDAALPVLTPLAVDAARPFPLIASLSLNLVLRLDAPSGDSDTRLAIVQVPAGLARLVPVEPGTYVLLEDIIATHLQLLFPGQVVLESAAIRLARDAELELDDEGGRTYLEFVEYELRKRKRSDVIRLEIESSASLELVERLRDQLDLTEDDVYRVPKPLDLRVLLALTEAPQLEHVREPQRTAVDALANLPQGDLFALLEERDILLHHPYEAYEPIIAFLAQAADDPDVLAIKQTLYRTSIGSPILASLQRAAERNKQVTVLVELTARFDEERNIQWARALEAAGAHVIYGVHGYKTHAKICLVVRRTAHGLKRYVHLSTGNYNERTARQYTDFGLLTTSQAIAEDASAFFNTITGYSDPPRFKRLVMAPTGLRRRFLRLIERERLRAEAGQAGEIVAKLNTLSDEEIIDALYAASRSGVTIRLNVRGICALRPGVAGLSENIEVVSIVDRYLEHSRIYYFHNAGEDELYLASADWMARNLDRRIELMFPIEAPTERAKVLYVLRAMFRDTVKARWLGPDGVYRRRPAASGDAAFRVQEHLYDETRRLAALTRDGVGVVFEPEQRAGQDARVTPIRRRSTTAR